MKEIEVNFYKKLNEYYQERDYLYTLKSYRGHSYSIVDFLLFVIISSVILLLGVALSIICQDIIYFSIFLLFSIVGYLISFIIVIDRRKQIVKTKKLEKELRNMIEDNKPLFDDKLLTLEDYIRHFEWIGFNIEIICRNKIKTYLIKGVTKDLKIITRNNFFINSMKCYIGDVEFNKIKNDDNKLDQLIKDYKLDSLSFNYYQMLFSFYKYIIETIDDYGIK